MGLIVRQATTSQNPLTVSGANTQNISSVGTATPGSVIISEPQQYTSVQGGSIPGAVATFVPVSGTSNSSNNAAQSVINQLSSGTNTAALDKLAAPTLANMGQLDAILANKNAQSQSEYQKNVDAYNAQNAIDKAAYDQNVHDNEYNYTKNNQAALLNAANASTGLRGFLSKIGALAGSGMDVIKRLVGMSSGADLGTSRDTFDTNAGTLNTNWSKAEQEQRQRLAEAESVLQNAKLTNENNMLTSKQAMLASLANLYGADTAQGQNYASQAASLAAPLSNTSKAVVAPYVSASSLYTPEALKAYLAGTATPTLSTDNTPTANSSLYYVDTKKKDNLTNAL